MEGRGREGGRREGGGEGVKGKRREEEMGRMGRSEGGGEEEKGRMREGGKRRRRRTGVMGEMGEKREGDIQGQEEGEKWRREG